jgi:integrase
LATEVQHKRLHGVDVIAEKKEAKYKGGHANNYADLSRQFVETYLRPRIRRWPQNARLLGWRDGEIIADSIADRWRHKSISEITGRDILAVIDECRNLTAPGLTRKRRIGLESEGLSRAMYASLSKFFNWCIGRLIIDRSPMSGLHRPSPPKSRDRILSDEEIRKFWEATIAVGEPFGPCFQLLLLTGQRLNEVARMTSDEIAGGLWSLSSARTKNKRSHFIPLSAMAQDIINHRGGGFLFTVNGKTPVSGFSKIKRRLDDMMQTRMPWRLHDLRRTVASRMAEIGIAPIVIEKALNHASGAAGGLVEVYQRHDYSGERRAAFDAWEVKLNEILSQR